jgi:hypothetical protein
MPRYQIGVGVDFPVTEELADNRGCGGGWGWRGGSGDGRRRFPRGMGAVLRGLLLLSLVVLAIRHPLAIALAAGGVLALRHSPWMRGLRARWWQARQACRRGWRNRRSDGGRFDDGAFV